MDKLAFFDFCGTIANYQTMDPYLKYVLAHEKPIKYYILCNTVSKSFFGLLDKVIAKVGVHCFLYKVLMIRQLKGISYSTLKKYGTKYYQQIVCNNLINETVSLLMELRKNGYRIVIVSGGSDLYIRDFAIEYEIKDLITAEFEFTSGKCTGRLLSECMYEEKKQRINAFIQEQDRPCTCEIACSDSASDIPMLELCMRKIVISHGAHQHWVTRDMEEIIWA